MLSISHLLVVLVIVLVLFGGGGRLSRVMGDIGKGIRNMRDELNPDDKSGTQEVLPPEEKK